MVRGLAIETSSRIGSVALVENGQCLGEESFPHGLQHAARIVPAIDQLCRQAGWTSHDLREVYVSAGPGSFTGLRIGITFAKTLAFMTGAALIAVPSVRVLAENAPADARRLVIVIDAKRGQIFSASFDRQGDAWTPREPAQLCALAEMLARTPRPVHLLGEGIPFHQDSIRDQPAEEVIVTAPSLWQPTARAVARIGWEMAREGQFTDPLRLTPIYIRRPEAEEKADRARETPNTALPPPLNSVG